MLQLDTIGSATDTSERCALYLEFQSECWLPSVTEMGGSVYSCTTSIEPKNQRSHSNQPSFHPLRPHLLGNVVPVHVALAGVHLLLVEETATVRHQKGLAHVLSLCSGMEEKVLPLWFSFHESKIRYWQSEKHLLLARNIQ